MTYNTTNTGMQKRKVAEILKNLFTNANGDSADVIRKYQGTQLPSFGIMYPQLKELSLKYERDNDVAEILMDKNTREARILAFLLCEPDKISDLLLTKFEKQAITEELKNLMARHVIAPLIIGGAPQRISKLLTNTMLVKGTIQAYRIYKTAPDYSTCLSLLTTWVAENKAIRNTDGKSLSEIIYRTCADRRQVFIDELKTMQTHSPILKAELAKWIADFNYLD